MCTFIFMIFIDYLGPKHNDVEFLTCSKSMPNIWLWGAPRWQWCRCLGPLIVACNYTLSFILSFFKLNYCSSLKNLIFLENTSTYKFIQVSLTLGRAIVAYLSSFDCLSIASVVYLLCSLVLSVVSKMIVYSRKLRDPCLEVR